jgi:hypothetical protein
MCQFNLILSPSTMIRVQGGVRESTLRDVFMSIADATHQEEFESQFHQQLHQQRAEERRRQRLYNRKHPPQAKHTPDLAVQDSSSNEVARNWLMSLLFSNSTSASDNDKENEIHPGGETALLGKESTKAQWLTTTDGSQTATDGDDIGSSALLHKPLPSFEADVSYNVPKDTGGYVTFAQRVNDPDMTPFHMPCVDTVSHRAVPCPSSKSAPSQKGNYSTEYDNRRLLNSEAPQRGGSLPLLDLHEEDFHDVAFRSDMELLLATNNKETAMLEHYYQNGETLRPRLGSSGNEDEDKGSVEQLKLVVSRTAATPFSYTLGLSKIAVDEKHTELTLQLERTVPLEEGCLCILHFVNARTSANVKALVVGVHAWARNGRSMHFLTAEGGGDPQEAAAFFNKNFRGGDEIRVEYENTGMPYERNMAVTWIEGNKYHPGFEKSPSIERIGATYRDYIVYVSCVVNYDAMWPA